MSEIIKTEEENFENTKIEEIETVQTEIEHDGIGFIEESDDEITGDANDFNELSEQYRQTKIHQEITFIDPVTGESISREQLPPLEQIMQTAKAIGQVLNAPKKDCRKCHGRGYTGINLAGNVPVACDCLYKEHFKTNKRERFIPENRKTKRYYGKAMQQYIQDLAKKERARLEIIEKSKANLRKNTPTAPKTEEVHIETAEGSI